MPLPSFFNWLLNDALECGYDRYVFGIEAMAGDNRWHEQQNSHGGRYHPRFNSDTRDSFTRDTQCDDVDYHRNRIDDDLEDIFDSGRQYQVNGHQHDERAENDEYWNGVGSDGDEALHEHVKGDQLQGDQLEQVGEEQIESEFVRLGLQIAHRNSFGY